MLTKSSVRPARPVFQMCFHPKMLECKRTVDRDYDRAISDYFEPYYHFIDAICRVALQNTLVTSDLVGLCSVAALESLHFHSTIFPKLYLDLIGSESEESTTFVDHLCSTSYFHEYVTLTLTQERQFLNNELTYEMLKQYLPKIQKSVLTPTLMNQVLHLINAFCQIINTLDINKQSIQLNGDLRAVYLVFMIQTPTALTEEMSKTFCETLNKLKAKCDEKNKCETGETPQKKRKTKDDTSDSEPGMSSGSQNPDNSDSSDVESSVSADNGCERLISTLNDLLEKLESK